MRILVIGAGVLGSLYAGRFAAAGEQVTILARGARQRELQDGPLRLVDLADGAQTLAHPAIVSRVEPGDLYDLALVMVRADQIDRLLPDLARMAGVGLFLFMHNLAAGTAALAAAVGPQRFLLGFPGAGGERSGNTVRYRLIAEQPTTLGEPTGVISRRLREVAPLFARAGFAVARSRRMDDWLKTHAVFVTAISGAIYGAGGSANVLARRPGGVRMLVRAIRQGFARLSRAGVRIEPRKLAILFALPAPAPEWYWRRYLARPAAEQLFAAHARSAAPEMAALVEDLRSITAGTAVASPELDALWAEVAAAGMKQAER